MTSRGDFNQDIVVRFAPSPNGLLHLGHAYAAMVAHDYAREAGGRFLLRIEDIDTARTRPEYVQAILDDLRWLGLQWDGDPLFQSARFDEYATAIEKLKQMGVLYPCFCSRSDMRAAQEAGGFAKGPDGPIYPGTCRDLPPEQAAQKMAGEPHSWRLDIAKALAILEPLSSEPLPSGPLSWVDGRRGEQLADPAALGDVVIQPKDTPVSYHLAVTMDDARDGISDVVRGEDLFASTHVHRLLQALLELPVPRYYHHGILLDETGEKLSKSRASASLAVLRKSYADGTSLIDKLRKGNLPLGISLTEG